jgi:Zn-dependent protease
MRDVTSWSVSCGRGTDVDLRLHASFFVALAVFLQLAARTGGGDNTIVGIVAVVVYIVSLLAHELAHAMTAWKWGGRIDCVLLGPHGGLLPHGAALDARGDFAVAVSGPLANMAITATAVITLAAAGRPVSHVFFPFAPPSAALEANVLGAITLTAWINWLFVVINALPMSPLDGGRILTAFVRERSDAQSAVIQASRIGLVTSVGCFVAFWFVPADYDAAAFTLLLLSVVGGFSSLWEVQRATNPDYDESLRYDEADSGLDLDDPRPRRERLSPLRAWWRRRQEAKARERQQTERDEEQRADEVLARLHDGGIESLSAQDRALLERVSARYRRRH